MIDRGCLYYGWTLLLQWARRASIWLQRLGRTSQAEWQALSHAVDHEASSMGQVVSIKPAWD